MSEVIKVKVFAPGFCSFEHIDKDGFMELKEGSKLNDVYKKIKMPIIMKPFMICSINYNKAGLNTALKDGDIVSFWLPIAGG